MDKDTDTPITGSDLIRRVVLLSLLTLIDALQIYIIWPFIFFMVRDFHINETQVGLYGGILGGTFFLAQMCGSFLWGYVSDILGRKRILLIIVFGSSITMSIFGFSHSYAVAMVFRFLSGFFRGSAIVCRAYLNEITTKENQSWIFSLYMTAQGFGAMVGPAVGGFLNSPATRYPSVFGTAFWQKYPYALPCVVSGGIGILFAILAAFFLPESPSYARFEQLQQQEEQDRKRKEQSMLAGQEDSETTCLLSDEKAKQLEQQIDKEAQQETVFEREKNMGFIELLSQTDILMSCIALIWITAVRMAFDEITPIFLETNRSIGGMSMSSNESGMYMLVAGIFIITNRAFLLPFVLKLLGPVRCYKVFMWCMCLFLGSFYWVSLIPENQHVAIMLTMGTLMCVRGIISSSIWTSASLLVNNSAIPATAGKINGMSEAFTAFAHLVSTIINGQIWSASFHLHAFRYHQSIVYLANATFAAIMAFVALKLPYSLDYPKKK